MAKDKKVGNRTWKKDHTGNESHCQNTKRQSKGTEDRRNEFSFGQLLPWPVDENDHAAK